MSRLRPVRQQGFSLLVFVLMASIVSLSLVLGFSGLLTKEEANRRPVKLQQELEQSRDLMLGFYGQYASALDNPSLGASHTVEEVVAGASVKLRRGMKAGMSNLLSADGGVMYRRLVLYYPSETDQSNPPDLATFVTTGTFKTCSKDDEPCGTRQYIEFSSLELEKAAMVETQRRLERVALKAQAYFKARMLQDPEKNISMNYFRPAFGVCDSLQVVDLECLDEYTPIAIQDGGTWLPHTNLPPQLGLTGDELVSAWGDPIEALSKLPAGETDEPPHSMLFRAPSPFGGYVTVRAIQQI